MNQLVNFYAQNRVVINFLVALVVYVIAHRKAAVSFVKGKASKAMFGVEKSAEQLILKTGSEKMDTVEDIVYKNLPGWVRIVVSPQMFRSIAQKFFDESKVFIDQNAKVPEQPNQPQAK